MPQPSDVYDQNDHLRCTQWSRRFPVLRYACPESLFLLRAREGNTLTHCTYLVIAVIGVALYR